MWEGRLRDAAGEKGATFLNECKRVPGEAEGSNWLEGGLEEWGHVYLPFEKSINLIEVGEAEGWRILGRPITPHSLPYELLLCSNTDPFLADLSTAKPLTSLHSSPITHLTRDRIGVQANSSEQGL